MANSTEDYLDSLLRQAMGIEEPKKEVADENLQPINDEVINENNEVLDETLNTDSDDLQNISLATAMPDNSEVNNVEDTSTDGQNGVEFSSDKVNDFFADNTPFEEGFVFPEEALKPDESMEIPEDMQITSEGLDILNGSEAVAEELPVEEPEAVAEELPVEEPETVAEELPVEEPETVAEELPVEEPETVAEELPVEEPEAVAEELPVEEPEAVEEELPVEEPEAVAEELAAEAPEAVVEEPPVDETVSEEPELKEDDEISDLLNSLDNIDEAIAKEGDLGNSTDLDLGGLDLGEVDLGAMLDNINQEIEDNNVETSTSTDDLDAADLNDLLNSIDGDEDISDIGSMLNKDENAELVDPNSGVAQSLSDDGDPFAFDDAFENKEESEEEDGKKKKKKKEKKPRKKRKKGKDDFDDLGGEGEIALDLNSDELANLGEEKKPGFIKRFLDKLFEEMDDDDEGKVSVIEESAVDIAAEGAVENEEILKQLEEEPDPNKKKKDKKDKKKKKDKKGKGEGEEGEEGSENTKKKKKEKKKKEKPEEPEVPTKKLPKKKVFASVGLCLSFAAVLIVLAFFFPYSLDKRQAKRFYATGNYQEVYDSLRGHKLNEKEQLMYDRAFNILKAERYYDSYVNYMKLNKKLEALDALIKGVKNMDENSEKANELGIGQEFGDACNQIITVLESEFGVTVEQARYFNQLESREEYTKALYDCIYNNIPRDENGNLIYTVDEANRELMLTEEDNL